MNKLLARADILTAISELQTKQDDYTLDKVINSLSSIEDKDFVLNTMMKELLKSENNVRQEVTAFLLIEIIPSDVLDNEVQKALISKKISDTQKYKLIKLLRAKGTLIKYENFEDYLDNPDIIINEDTNVLLKNSIVNPEVQIDFMDFLSSVSENDGCMLIESLIDDYKGDLLTNILYPILYSMPETNYFSKVIELLGQTKSKKALKLLEKFKASYTDSPMISSIIKKSINMLKLSIGEEKTEENLLDSKMYKCFVSIPDGRSNLGILISRIRKEGTLQLFAVALSLKSGIIDCFGFNEISRDEFVKIINRFYSGKMPKMVNAEVAKYILSEAESKQFNAHKRIPYEYVCWKHLLSDVNDITKNKNDLFAENIQKLQLTKESISELADNFAELDYWYFDENNEDFAKIISQISNELTHVNDEDIFKFFIEKFDQLYNQMYNPKTMEIVDYQLLISAYLLNMSSEYKNAAILYSLIDNGDIKKEFLSDILKKSIYMFFIHEKNKAEQEFMSKNIFQTKKNSEPKILSENLIKTILVAIENEWLDDE